MNMFKNLKKEVEYNGKRYIITFETIETDEFDITYAVVNNMRVNVRTYADKLTFDELKTMINDAIKEYLKVIQIKKDTQNIIDEFKKWDGKL